MDFDIIGEITGTQTIATGSGIRELGRLRKRYGRGRWRKRKGIAEIRLASGEVVQAELHWYEATGIGKREMKIKAFT
jgi:hypothetical protein